MNKELPKRENIRLQNYDYSSNGLYFVTICTEDKKTILSHIVGDDAHIVPKKIILKPYSKNVDKEKLEHKSYFKKTTIYWNEVYHLNINVQEIYTGMIRGIKQTSGKIIEISFDDAESKQNTHFIECFRGSGIDAEMLKNTIQYTYDKTH